MYEYVPRPQIIEVLKHLRELLRREEPITERGRLAAERREVTAKYIISNLPRTGPHPTLNTVIEVMETFLLTIGAAHRLFGYDLDAIREYDLRLNSGRTHIVETYVFERERLIDFPSDLAPESSFQSDALLRDLVREWQTGTPIRAPDERPSNGQRAFYVHVGTQDSWGSSLPPGSLALVDPVDIAEAQRPNPRFIYLLQFGRGYRCSRCVVTRGKLQMLTSGRSYVRAREFACPGEVRVAGRIRMFAHALPQPEYDLNDRLRPSRFSDLILPWEYRTRDELFLSQHRRFHRSNDEEADIKDLLMTLLDSPLTKRTERRYRHPGSSEPHVSTLIQLTLLYFARYSDALRAGGVPIRERGRFTIERMARATNIEELFSGLDTLRRPRPEAVWTHQRGEFLDWVPLLAFKFPGLNLKDDSVLRLSRSCDIPGHQPTISAGSWMLLKPLDEPPAPSRDHEKSGWSRPLYVLRRGMEFLTGHLEQDGAGYALLSKREGIARRVRLAFDQVHSLHAVTGVAVPV